MKKKTIGHAAGVFSALALMCASLMFASCDYWNEDWYKNGESETSSGYNMGSSDSSSSSSGSSDSSSGSSDASAAAGNYTATISGASGTSTLEKSMSETIACLGAAVGDTLTVTVKDASGNAVTSGVTYQWQKVGDAASDTDNDGYADTDADGDVNGGPAAVWLDISGATAASYTITTSDVTPPSALGSSGSGYRVDFRCKVTKDGTALEADVSQYVRVSFTVP